MKETAFDVTVEALRSQGFNAEEILEELSKLFQNLPNNTDHNATANTEEKLQHLLLELGVPSHLKGYRYLLVAIPLYKSNPDQIITKELYPAVAAACRCQKEHVERSIRSAINIAWKRRDEQIWQAYFHPEPDGTIRRPTNGAFITRLADSLRPWSNSPDIVQNNREKLENDGE